MTRSWRRSRWVRLAASLPLVRDLPIGRLEALSGRAVAFLHLTRDLQLRLRAWLRAARMWAASGPGVRPGRAGGRARFAGWLSLLGAVLGVHEAALRGRAGSPTPAPKPWPAHPPRAEPEPLALAIYTSSAGNFFHAELADLLAHGLRASGLFRVERRDETTAPASHLQEHLVVAPHEFFTLGGGMRSPEELSFRRRCTLLLAEQPGTKHFALCLPYAAQAKLVLDVNLQSLALLRGAGLPAFFFPVGYDPDFEAFAPGRPCPSDTPGPGVSFAGLAATDPAARPIDVFFTGVLTRRRAAFFAEHARFFAARRCFLSLPTPHTPLGVDVPSALGTEAATALSQRSKILLNVHRDDRAYFEWHRIAIRGFWQKTLVVSEPSLRPPGVEPGVHLLEAELHDIPALLGWLLDTEEGRRKAESVRQAAFELLTTRYDLRTWSAELYQLYAAARDASAAEPGIDRPAARR